MSVNQQALPIYAGNVALTVALPYRAQALVIPACAGIYSPSLSLGGGEVTGQSRTTPGPIRAALACQEAGG